MITITANKDDIFGVSNLDIVLVGSKKTKTISTKIKVSVDDYNDYKDDINKGINLLSLIHPSDIPILKGLSNGEEYFRKSLDNIIELVEIVPSLLSEDDRWFTIYLVNLSIAYDSRR